MVVPDAHLQGKNLKRLAHDSFREKKPSRQLRSCPGVRIVTEIVVRWRSPSGPYVIAMASGSSTARSSTFRSFPAFDADNRRIRDALGLNAKGRTSGWQLGRRIWTRRGHADALRVGFSSFLPLEVGDGTAIASRYRK